jgi:hypothetical protein
MKHADESTDMTSVLCFHFMRFVQIMRENMKHADESIDVTSASCVHFLHFVLIMHENKCADESADDIGIMRSFCVNNA